MNDAPQQAPGLDGAKRYSGEGMVVITPGRPGAAVCAVVCATCMNRFWIPDTMENAPSACPWCEAKFRYIDKE